MSSGRSTRGAVAAVVCAWLLMTAVPQGEALTPFVSEAVNTTALRNSTPSLALDSQGNPHISYLDLDNGLLMWARKVGGGAFVVGPAALSTLLGPSSSIAVDAQDNPHILYFLQDGSVPQDLYYVRRESGNWRTGERLSTTNPSATGFSLALDGQGNPGAVYHDFVNSTLSFVSKPTGTWDRETIASSVSSYSLAFDIAGNPHIAYRSDASLDLKYRWRSNNVWTSAVTVDTQGNVGEDPSLVIDGLGTPHISYYDATKRDLKYSSKLGGAWTAEVVDSIGSVGSGSSLALDSQGRPHIAYVDDTNGDLKYASRIGGSWIVETVEAQGNVGGSASLALDDQGVPHMSYWDYTNSALKYATLNTAAVTQTVATTSPIKYAGVAFPVLASDPSLARTLVPQLGTISDSEWRLGHWTPGAGYQSAANGQITSVEVGRGYWLITKDAKTVQVTGIPLSLTTTLATSLVGGDGAWNQLGNPFLADVPVSLMRVVGTDGVRQPLTSENNLTYPIAYMWDVGTQKHVPVTSETVVPKSGMFWVQKKSNGPVDLIVDPGSAAPSLATTQASPATSISREWDIKIHARQGDLEGPVLVVGAAAVAPGVWNPLDVGIPPDPPGRHLRLTVPKRDWGGPSGDYVTEFQPPAERMEWVFELRAAEVPGEVDLGFEVHSLPADAAIRLVDERSGYEWTVENGAVIRLAATGDPRVLRLVTERAHAGMESSGTRESIFRVYPNPARGESGFLFRSERAMDISVSVFDVSGRRLRELRRAAAPRGENVLVWDGRDGQGNEVGPGVYFARYATGDQTGVMRVVRLGR
jgi:hypothetical protein